MKSVKKLNKKERLRLLCLRIFTFFLIAVLLAGTFYYVIAFAAQMAA